MPKQAPPQLLEFKHQIERTLDWSELDQLGHANNARYFTWFEEARMSYFQQVGIPVTDQLGWGPILAHTECNFLAPVTWPATLVLSAKVEHIGQSSFKMIYAVYLKPSEPPIVEEKQTTAISSHTSTNDHLECMAFGTGIIVLVDYHSAQKVKVSEALKQSIRDYQTL